MNPFDVAKNISQDKVEIELESDYTQFMINRIMSCSTDLVYLANEANKFVSVDNKTHYNFWFNVVHKKKRYFKYPKQEKFDFSVVDKIKDYYSMNQEQALECLNILSEEQVKYILESYKHGKF